MLLAGGVEVGLVEVGLLDPAGLVVLGDPGTQGFATVADVPLGVELLLVLVLEPMFVLDTALGVPLVLQGPDTVPVPLVPIPVEVVPTWLGVVVLF